MILDCSIVIPTYYPGEIIKNLFQSLPKVREIIILDNASDINLKSLITSEYNFINYIDVGDIGLGKTFNYSLEISKSENIFITQPDVILHKNCLENIIKKKQDYPKAAILSPLVFEQDKYAYYDAPPLTIINKKYFANENKPKYIAQTPSGDVSVQAVTSTAIFLNRNLIKDLGGWDDYFYTYLEDIDLSVKVRQSGYEIIKICNSRVNHSPFSSHDSKNHVRINFKRIFNFARSSLYFRKKHDTKKNFNLFFIKYLSKSLFSFFFNLIFCNFKKTKKNFYKLKGIYSFLKSI
jgi:N-acetylglucosaminyl-diphospho-decaprenol L-rhamnosyltransferase